ncbi:cytochrome P450 [Dothidotthia symphoricarpi CBS 119687]|uniref:Cytochrome P450 n=1 Tax=Dothidotthia symphoricarpi CBS 119687 TaxID=1392245 RepID=A0A6A6A809_9PLEO|nr:cytochrome P450 [Dothidotthia symphoricarpi CBS 119687]KAF2126947.1 cytochrome P450 [Dothidotthia symphoricarpi CBS 119687]
MIFSSLLGFLQRQAVPLTILLLITLPFLTYYVSMSKFVRKANSKALGKRPPTIPYWIPGVYHTISLVSVGPQKYFGMLIKEFGSFAPFVVKAGSHSILVLRDPNHIQKILRSPKQLTSTAFTVRTYSKVFGSPKTALKMYSDKGVTEKQREALEYTHLTLPRKHLTGVSLIPVADLYTSTLSSNLNDKMFQTEFWTMVEDFWSFFQQTITRCILETLFGSALLKQYPSVVRDYWEFDTGIENFTRGLPRFVMPAAHDARDRLHRGIEKWLKTNHSGTDFARFGDDDPVWDEQKGSKFIQERDDVFAKASLDMRARTSEILAIMHGSLSNLVPSTLWMIIEILRRPHLANHLTADILKYSPPQIATYDIATITDMPLFRSIHAEIGRLRVASSTVRTSEVDNFQLDDQWTLPKGLSVLLLSHDISMNTKLWAKTRPRTVERPLEEFWAERFLIPDKVGSKHRRVRERKEQVEIGRFDMDGLETLHTTFEGGDHFSPGQAFVQAMQAATLAVLFTEFEARLCDPDEVAELMPPILETAYGVMKPLGKIAIQIRKRKPSQKV